MFAKAMEDANLRRNILGLIFPDKEMKNIIILNKGGNR